MKSEIKKTPEASAREKANREYYYKRGLCPWCGGKRELKPGRRRCKECLIKDADYHRVLYIKKKYGTDYNIHDTYDNFYNPVFDNE